MPETTRPRAHVVISTNKWFSAVSEYALQLCLHLADQRLAVLCLAHERSPLQGKWRDRGLPTGVIPLLGGGALGWWKAWRSLPRFLRDCLVSSRSVVNVPEHGNAGRASGFVDNFVDNSETYGIVWVFEGREHTLCAIHRALHPVAWKGWRLVRVRGQAAPVKDGFVNRITYGKGADVLVCAAGVVARRIPFHRALPRSVTFAFCSRFSRENRARLDAAAGRSEPFPFGVDAPAIDPALPLFLVVGRFDPVKGHSSLLEAVAALFSDGAPARVTSDRPVQIVFVGKSENVHAHDLVLRACGLWRGSAAGHGARQCVTGFEGRARLHVFDERIDDVASLMACAHYGVIPSLASEVICRVAVEFLQSGTPLVSSTAGALSEVIPRELGHFFEPGDVAGLARAIRDALDLLLDHPERHAALRPACRDAGENRYGSENYGRLVGEIVRLTLSGGTNPGGKA